MLTAEELARLRKYYDLIAGSGGRIDILTREEQRDMHSLLGKWLEQTEESPQSQSVIPEPYATIVRRELRKIPTWKLKEAYEKLKAGEVTGIELVEQNRAYAISAIEEILWERGKLEGSWLETRRKAQELIDSLLGGESIEFEILGGKFTIPVPRWIREIKVVHHSAEEFAVDSKLPSREAAVEAVASSTWARGWATGMLTRFYPKFDELSPSEKERLIREWTLKLADAVVRPYVPLGS